MYPEIFNRFNFKEGHLDSDIIHTRCGSVQLKKYDVELNREINFTDKKCFDFYCKKEISTNNDAVFEWLDICESIECATDNYTFVELGAGYARWSVIAYYIASILRPLFTKLVIVEAEPTHFGWVIDNLEMNNINVENHEIYQGAIDDTEKIVQFEIGDPSKCYGQSIVNDNLVNMLYRKIRCWRQKKFKTGQYNLDVLNVKTYTLNSILSDIDYVDMIHMDIQGKEFDVLKSSADIINKKVKRLHIGTHSVKIEENIRELMLNNNWSCLRDYKRNKINDTPFGKIEFGDGIQTWINPAL